MQNDLCIEKGKNDFCFGKKDWFWKGSSCYKCFKDYWFLLNTPCLWFLIRIYLDTYLVVDYLLPWYHCCSFVMHLLSFVKLTVYFLTLSEQGHLRGSYLSDLQKPMNPVFARKREKATGVVLGCWLSFIFWENCCNM